MLLKVAGGQWWRSSAPECTAATRFGGILSQRSHLRDQARSGQLANDRTGGGGTYGVTAPFSEWLPSFSCRLVSSFSFLPSNGSRHVFLDPFLAWEKKKIGFQSGLNEGHTALTHTVHDKSGPHNVMYLWPTHTHTPRLRVCLDCYTETSKGIKKDFWSSILHDI